MVRAAAVGSALVTVVAAASVVLPDYDAGHGHILSELRIVFADPRTTHGVLIEVAEWVE